MKWEVLGKSGNIIETLLKNRGIKNKKEFFNPLNPSGIKLKALGVNPKEINRAIRRIKLAKSRKENVLVYGDYDADGICATAVLWEALHDYGLDVLPHIPDRFEEGYGINARSVENLKLKIKNLKLIVTVDNGIVAYDGIAKAQELGIDVIVIDHHAKGTKKLKAYAVLHTTSVCGSALGYFFAKELGFSDGLELAAVGTIADQMPLTGVNRSIVKYGLETLKNTKRPGLNALFSDAKIENIGMYEVNYIIAPRLNAMGRLAHGIDSLRLLCTIRLDRARELSKLLNDTNFQRQTIVESMSTIALNLPKGNKNKVLVAAHESFHEGVIGLAAGKLAEEYYRPAIVISQKGEISKASARSIFGFNIIEAIRATNLILEGGGHPMAAGFSIETSKISAFTKKINEIADELLTGDLLEKKLRIDMEINFNKIDPELTQDLARFAPFGMGNPTPTFATKKVSVLEVRPVGKEAKHFKLKLKQNDKVLDAIWFNATLDRKSSILNHPVSIAYTIEENTWNGYTNLQLKIKDIVVAN